MSKDNEWFAEHFPDGTYADVEGLCKVVDLDDLKEQDYSLSPGRYVGINNDIDMDFDYKGRVDEIRKELVQLNTQANELMVKIQKVEL